MKIKYHLAALILKHFLIKDQFRLYVPMYASNEVFDGVFNF
jgi:hypothetical protein